ncbi:MAG: hydroxymethylglutaryl-CoA lyase [bacterium]|nr:hydroxymethylglutaryl-CoA lyase [bacterium]
MSCSALPSKVTVVEVGPRDGLQNEKTLLDASTKIQLITKLRKTGLPCIEVGSLVSPDSVPQMANSDDVFEGLSGGMNSLEGIRFPLLVANAQGLERAFSLSAKDIALFTATTDSFTRKNIGCTVAESLNRFQDLAQKAKSKNLWVRGYVSCVLDCPYEGSVSPERTAEIAEALFKMGCDEISLGDTIGTGTPGRAISMVEAVAKKIPRGKIALHFHDTYGQALANIYACLEKGISIVDSSVAGLGGCPYAKGASGNVATEDVLYLLKGLNIETGVKLGAVAEIGHWITKTLNTPNRSNVGFALLS